jgi:hypothetical protein
MQPVFVNIVQVVIIVSITLWVVMLQMRMQPIKGKIKAREKMDKK